MHEMPPLLPPAARLVPLRAGAAPTGEIEQTFAIHDNTGLEFTIWACDGELLAIAPRSPDGARLLDMVDDLPTWAYLECWRGCVTRSGDGSLPMPASGRGGR